MSLPDARKSALIAQGFTGAANDMLLAWAKDGGASSLQLNDAILEVLKLNGATSLSLPDAWLQYLRGQGYTGSRNDMEYQFWKDGGTFLVETLLAFDSFTEALDVDLDTHVSDSGYPFSGLSWFSFDDPTQDGLIIAATDDVHGEALTSHYSQLDTSGLASRPTRIECDTRITTLGKTNVTGIAIRLTDDTPVAVFCKLQPTTQKIQIFEGVVLRAETITALAWNDVTVYRTIKMTDAGDSITAEGLGYAVDCEVTWEAAGSANINEKRCGLWVASSANTTYYNNFKVYGDV